MYYTEKLNIAIVMMDSIYPQRGGVHEQVYLLLRELPKLGARAELVAYHMRKAEEVAPRLLWLRSFSYKFVKSLRRADYDVLLVETAWSVLPAIASRLAGGPRCVLHLHSIESKQDVGLGRVGRALVSVLERLGRLCDAIVALSKVDAKLLKDMGFKRVYVIPPAIDLESFESARPAELKKPAVVFVGGMGYPPNREAAQVLIEVARIIKSRKREVNFYLVGPSPPPVSPPIYATGYVESTAPYVLGADVCVAPVYRGGGIKTKVLEYMAAGKPIVATRKAVEGIDDIKYLEAYTPEEFADRLLDVIDGNVNVDFGENARIVRERHAPERVASKILEVLEGVIHG